MSNEGLRQIIPDRLEEIFNLPEVRTLLGFPTDRGYIEVLSFIKELGNRDNRRYFTYIEFEDTDDPTIEFSNADDPTIN